MKFAFASLLFAATLFSQAFAESLRGSKDEERSLQGAKPLTKPCLLLKKVMEFEDKHHEFEWDCELDAADGGHIVGLSGIDLSSDQDDQGNPLVSGESTLFAPGMQVANFVATIPDKSKAVFARDASRRRKLLTAGTKTVLVVRAIAADATTSSSEAALSDNVFGTNSDPVNLKSQYAACSNNQLIFEPAEGQGITAGGTLTVTITESVTGVPDDIIRNAMTAAAQAQLGVSSLRSVATHTMHCIPPGTSGNWIAYAYVNSWLSVYNNNWCNFVSGQMHELGHNLNLAHSGESAIYDDQSGMMGFSYSSDDGPVMCFNAAKSYQLGWYNNQAEEITNIPTGGLSFTLEGLWTSPGANTKIIRLAGFHSLDYYVSYNLAEGINSGTREGGNQVLVHNRPIGVGYAESDLMAKLSAGNSYESGISGGFTVTVNSIANGLATVTICPSGGCTAPTPPPAPTASPTSAPTPVPAPTLAPTTAAPTPSPTNAPTASPTPAPPTASPSVAPSVSPTTAAPTNSPTIPPPTAPPTPAPTLDCSGLKGGECNFASGCIWLGGGKNGGCVPAP